MPRNAISKKLHLKVGQSVSIVNPPPGYERLLGLTEKSKRSFDFILVFVRTGKEFERSVPKVLSALQPEGILWISYPKQISNYPSDLSRDKCWKMMRKFRYQPVSQISIDDTWSALRFKPLAKVAGREVKTPLIDVEKRIVKIPEDLKIAFIKDDKTRLFSNSLSFTHRKEYVLWIESAKKEETRKIRVEKTMEMLAEGIKGR